MAKSRPAPDSRIGSDLEDVVVAPLRCPESPRARLAVGMSASGRASGSSLLNRWSIASCEAELVQLTRAVTIAGRTRVAQLLIDLEHSSGCQPHPLAAEP